MISQIYSFPKEIILPRSFLRKRVKPTLTLSGLPKKTLPADNYFKFHGIFDKGPTKFVTSASAVIAALHAARRGDIIAYCPSSHISLYAPGIGSEPDVGLGHIYKKIRPQIAPRAEIVAAAHRIVKEP